QLQNTTDQQPGNSKTSALNSISMAESQIILGTAIAHIKDARGHFQPIRMVIDSGSQNSFMTQKCLNKLGLTMSRSNKTICGIGQTLFSGARGKVICQIKPCSQSSPILTTEAIIVPTITSHLPSVSLPNAIVSRLSGYNLADSTFWKPGPVEFLLGVDLFTDIWTGAVTSFDDTTPKLFDSIFGQIVMGKLEGNVHSSTSLFAANNDSNLSFQLEKFWELESPAPTENVLSPEDLQCEEFFQKTHRRLENGTYEVRLPFRDTEPTVGDSSAAAIRRFHSLERKLHHNPELRELYHNFMKEYVDLDHMALAKGPSSFLIPHHGVLKENEEGKRIRVVFDASVKVPGGSLNDHLLVGGKLQNDIREILLRFRYHQVVFSTDIVKMFRMIRVHPLDRKFQNIYWRFNPNEAVQRFELKTVTYGLACAPFLAQRVLLQLVTDHGADYPQAAEAIRHQVYVDDILTGAHTFAAAIELKEQLIALLACGGFQLSKWSSNFLQLVPTPAHSPQQEKVDMSSKDETWVKILGLQWNPSLDTFSFKISAPNPIITKRGILSLVARIYDPLGLLTPTTFLMKSFIQELWKLSLDWDQEIPHYLQDSWSSILTQLPVLSKIQVPRFIGTSGDENMQIIGFCDASVRGYAAVIYLRVASETGWTISLLTSKSKLAPTKATSIPRLELCGALLLAQLYSSVLPIITSFKQPMLQPIFFCDSTITLSWIQTDSFRLKVFVANRVAKIQEVSPQSRWRHIISEENPCDAASRGILPSQLLDHPLWWTGPPWLKADDTNWPNHPYQALKDLPEMRAEQSALVSTEAVPLLCNWFERFSSFQTMVRAAGWIVRWIHNCRNPTNKRSGALSKIEYDQGKTLCIKDVQRHHFPSKQFMDSKFGNLDPFLDRDSVWRVGGRLRHAELPYTQRHPILLPHKCHFSSLMIDFYHKLYGHPGPNALQAVIQLQFWIPALRRLIRHRGFKCLKCYKSKANSYPPFMGDLPKFRVNGGRTFQHVGVDFAGPFPLKESSRRNAAIGKTYLCLYVCMATKALHLELVTRLTTEAFLASFQRFTSLRGLPTDVYSDCGSNFLGAASYLKELYQWFSSQTSKQELLDYALKTNIRWHFNPPQTPHMGGIWEAGVKSVKRHLRLMSSQTPLTYEEYTTLFSKIGAILNSRPLCPLSTDPNESDYLSPGHFMVGGPLVVAPEPSLLDERESLLTRWQLVSRKAEYFWKRWSREYLATLQTRPKWLQRKENVQIGDLVLLKEDSPPLHWKTARIIDVHPGRDNIVRVATVQTGRSSFKRPVVKLVPLLPLSSPPYP
ncbi:unnamed protein product, partial [Nesidiocoris tenuis]